MTKIAEGPWVLVVGMHRSGTSAVTGALGAMGLEPVQPGDRMDWPESNPEHWESLSLTLFNDEILARLGGSWDGPPDLVEGWEDSPDLEQVGDPLALISSAYPGGGPSVWKDPRLCILLPFWKKHLSAPLAAVFVWRAPLAVAQSLRQRDGMSLADGFALWERYNRTALANLEGIDTYVANYEDVVDDPSAFTHQLAAWLSTIGQFRDIDFARRLDHGGSSISDELRHQTGAAEEGGDTFDSPQQRALLGQLSDLAGGHRPLPPQPRITEFPWSSAIIGLRRQLSFLHREIDPVREELGRTKQELADANRNLANLHASTSWRMTKPLRTVISSLENVRHRPAED